MPKINAHHPYKLILDICTTTTML